MVLICMGLIIFLNCELVNLYMALVHVSVLVAVGELSFHSQSAS